MLRRCFEGASKKLKVRTLTREWTSVAARLPCQIIDAEELLRPTRDVVAQVAVEWSI